MLVPQKKFWDSLDPQEHPDPAQVVQVFSKDWKCSDPSGHDYGTRHTAEEDMGREEE